MNMRASVRLGTVLAVGCALWCNSVRAELRGTELRHDDPEVRGYLEENLPSRPKKPAPPKQEDLRRLAEVFENGDRYEKERVAWVLGDWGSPLGAELLLEACASEWPGVRAQAASSFGMLAPVIEGQPRQQVVRELRRLLTDQDSRVVLAALRGLGHYGDAGAVNAISRYLESDDVELAAAAIDALAHAGGESVEPLIIGALASPQPDVVLAAIEGIPALGKPELAQHLVGKLHADSPAQRVAAIRGIVSLKATAHEGELLALLDDPHGYIRREALKGLVEFSGPAHEKLYRERTRDPDHTVRRVAAQALGRFDLRSAIPDLYELFADPHLYVRDDAVISLAQMADERAIALAAQGLSSETATVRACSSQLLGRLKSDANLDAHIALLDDKDLSARQWAAWALGEIGRKEASEALNRVAFTPEEDMEVRSCAILSLGKLGFLDAMPRMKTLALDKPTMTSPGGPLPLRTAAVRAIGMLRQQGSVGLLVGRLTDWVGLTPELPEVRFEAAVALGRIGSAGGVDALEAHMKQQGEHPRIRVVCKWSLTQIMGRPPDYQIPPLNPVPPDYFVGPAQKRAGGAGAQ